MVIKGAEVVTSEGRKRCDVRIEAGEIVEIAEGLSAPETIDANGRYLLPALNDIGLMVYDRKLRGGTLDKLAQNAEENGFSTVVLSSLCAPRIEDEITLEFVKSQADHYPQADILPLVSGVKEDGKLADCAIMLREGGVGIEFESHIDGNLIRRLMEYAKAHDVPLYCHADDPALSDSGVMHEGEIASRLGLPGVPPLSEISQVARIRTFAEHYGVDVVFLGLSTPEAVEICAESAHLKAQVSIHHLILSDAACEGYDTAGKVWPVLRDESRRQALLKQAAEGKIDLLTSLHSPASRTAKDAVFGEAAFGIDGLYGFLPLLYSELIAPGHLTWEDVTRMCAKEGAKLLKREREGEIAVGQCAAFVLFDPKAKTRFDDSRSPYRGRTFQGGVTMIKG